MSEATGRAIVVGVLGAVALLDAMALSKHLRSPRQSGWAMSVAGHSLLILLLLILVAIVVWLPGGGSPAGIPD
jgi:hypothetical protein